MQILIGILMIFINRAARNIYIEIAGLPLSYITVSGMLMSVMLFTCIMLVFIDWRRGYRVASVFQLLMLLSSSFQVIVVGNTGALPGMISAVLAQVALRMISNQVKRSEQLTLTSYITGVPSMRGLLHELDRAVKKKKINIIKNLFSYALSSTNSLAAESASGPLPHFER